MVSEIYDRKEADTMSGVLKDLEPKEVFFYFEEICGIPHGSGNVEQISNYLVNFAKDKNLEYYQDFMKNVIIIKEASEGYEAEEPIIIQGHMDMVAVKKPDCSIDMKTEPLRLAVDGDNVYAEGTSLGGDDGIAVAYALALLASDSIAHPRLEVVLTVDEETGMDGARGIDLSMLKGHKLLNLDSEEEGIFLTSCAGGARVNCALPLGRSMRKGMFYEVTVCGLQGGHSGSEIDKERGNSNCLMGRLLAECLKEENGALVKLTGGLADNAIPRETEAQLLIWKEEEAFEKAVTDFESKVKKELESKEPDFQVLLKKGGQAEKAVFEEAANRAAVRLLAALPNGIQAMSMDVKGLVETSLNMGIVRTAETEMQVEFSVRSSIESAKEALIRKVEIIAELCGAESTVSGAYPGWAYRKDSPLRETLVRVYREMYGKEPEIQAIHAGLECGLLAEKIADLDCVSLGPDMKNIHTTEETLSISSVKRVWEFCVEVLKQKDE